MLHKINFMKLLEFNKRFDSEEDCETFLKEQREKKGIECAKCGCKDHYWDKCNKRWMCKKCGHVTTLTAGTVMHGSKLPLMYWFTAIHLLTTTKKTFSALEMQRQLGHKRYQPIWEMLHKLRSVMGQRDEKYKLCGTIELDEGYFTTEDLTSENESLKRGIGSQRKAKVLVMVESESVDVPRKGQKNRKCGHIKMQVIEDLKAETFKEHAETSIDKGATVVMDNLSSHAGVEQVVAASERQTVPGKDAPTVLPWVHVAIANAKSLLRDMYHGIKRKYLQSYLSEFCYKLNRTYFGDKTFDRLVVAAVTYKPLFKNHSYQVSHTNG